MASEVRESAAETKLLQRVQRAYETGQRVVLFVGAPAAQHPGAGGVPGVGETAERAREELGSGISTELGKAWKGLDAPRRYQRAFGELLDVAGADAANRVIRDCVLTAFIYRVRIDLIGSRDAYFLSEATPCGGAGQHPPGHPRLFKIGPSTVTPGVPQT